MKRITAILGMLLAFPTVVFAVNLPMTKSAVTPATLGEAIAKNDQVVLNVTGFEYIAAIQKFHPEVGTGGIQDYVEYVKNLELRDLPQGVKFVFARVEKRGGSYDVKSFERVAKPREKGLYDRNIGKFIASADCGNVMKQPEIPVAEVPRSLPTSPVLQPQASASPPMVAQHPMQLQPMPMFAQPSSVNFGRAYEDCPSGSSCGQAAELGRALIYGGSLIGYGAVLRPPQYTITNDVSSSSTSSADASASSSAAGGSGGTVIIKPPPRGGPIDPNP